MLKICFSTDGGLGLGMGHVQQSVTLAKELRAARPDGSISFLTKSDLPVIRMIQEAGFEVTRLDDDQAILQRLTALAPNTIVFDKLDVAEDLARDIREKLAAKLIIFTNLTAANKHAHVAVTADIGSQFKNVTYTDHETGTRYYYGPKYWVLRRDFYEYQRLEKPPPKETRSVLLIFGGSDPANVTSVVLDVLLDLSDARRIDMVLGAHFGHDEAVRRVLASHPAKAGTVTLHRNIKNVAELMYKADLTIASPGLSAFEALRVGTPVIVVPQDALQRDTYRGFMRMVTREDVGELGGMIARSEFTYPREDAIRAMEIGEGIPELLDEILKPVEREQA
jgi:spore coat polysaccharide biosynthesis predicted glycosyltransferase SpsG